VLLEYPAGHGRSPSKSGIQVTDPSARGWEAVDHAEERLRERAAARQRADDRRRRRRRGLAWTLRIVMPLLGAAVVLAAFERGGGDLRDWSEGTAVAVLLAAVVVPALIIAWTARPRVAEMVLWALVSAAAVVALVFGAGFALLELGPR